MVDVFEREKQELIDKANERALNDLGLVSDMLQKGPQGLLEQAIDDLLNQKDPDCSVDNKAFIMEDVESAADKLEDLNDYFKRIEKVFMKDLLEGRFSVLGNILIVQLCVGHTEIIIISITITITTF